jgi:hypothetical protein
MRNKNLLKFKLLLTSLIILFTFSCSIRKKEKGCEQFKNGKFLFNLKGEMKNTSFIIERKDSIQIETEKVTGFHTKLSIKWTDKCKYEVKMLETSFNFPDSIQNIRRTNAFKTEILNWTDDYYVFKSHRDNSSFTLTDTMWVIK